MSQPILPAATVLLAAVLSVSGLVKIGRPIESIRAMRALRVPDVLVRDWVARLHPVAEIALAVGLLALATPWRWAAAVGALGLLAAYTWWVVATVRRGDAVSCNCFGRRASPVGPRTVVRNGVLLTLAGLAVLDCVDGISAPVVRLLELGL
ncbi:MAG: MauE/DoxX family redox-associated membrane protein [Candidatus Phosphoribacter sp.]|nr:hypothetical protein [Actinomycetales bacterium]